MLPPTPGTAERTRTSLRTVRVADRRSRSLGRTWASSERAALNACPMNSPRLVAARPGVRSSETRIDPAGALPSGSSEPNSRFARPRCPSTKGMLEGDTALRVESRADPTVRKTLAQHLDERIRSRRGPGTWNSVSAGFSVGMGTAGRGEIDDRVTGEIKIGGQDDPQAGGGKAAGIKLNNERMSVNARPVHTRSGDGIACVDARAASAATDTCSPMRTKRLNRFRSISSPREGAHPIGVPGWESRQANATAPSSHPRSRKDCIWSW